MTTRARKKIPKKPPTLTSRITERYNRFQSYKKARVKAHPRIWKLLLLISPFIVYLIISLIYFGPSSLSELHSSFFNPSPDPQLVVWALNWWPFSIVHHLHPFYTHYIWYPQGFDLAWATSIPTLAIIMAPITLLFGAILSYNILALISLAMAACACYYLVYYLTKNYLASLFAGYMFGFSSYELAQLVGHPSLYITFLLPLLVLAYLLRLNGRIKRLPYVLITGLMLLLQFGISNEIFASFMVFGILAAALFYLFSGGDQRKLILRTTVEFLAATFLCLIFLIPYFYYLIKGANAVPNIINSPTGFSADLLNYIIPTPVTRLGSSQSIDIANRFSANFSEDGAYLGLPTFLIIAYFSLKRWRKSYVRALVILLILLIVFALGPKLHVYGNALHVYLPWGLTTNLPLLRSALPVRFTLYVALIAAVIVGLWLASKSSPRRTLAKYAVVIIAVICIMPSSIYHWQNIPLPSVFSANQVNHYIQNGSNIIILPYGILGDSMYYQYESGMSFTQSGGYIGFTPPSFSANPVVGSFYSGVPEPHFDADLTNFCVSLRVSKIVYMPNTSPALIDAIHQLGWNQQRVGQAVIVTVPKKSAS